MISLQENYLSKDAFKNNFKKLQVKFCAIGALWSPPQKKETKLNFLHISYSPEN